VHNYQRVPLLLKTETHGDIHDITNLWTDFRSLWSGFGLFCFAAGRREFQVTNNLDRGQQWNLMIVDRFLLIQAMILSYVLIIPSSSNHVHNSLSSPPCDSPTAAPPSPLRHHYSLSYTTPLQSLPLGFLPIQESLQNTHYLLQCSQPFSQLLLHKLLIAS